MGEGIFDSIMRNVDEYGINMDDVRDYGRSDNENIICMKNIKSEKIKWLWYPYIPLGKVTILQGDPGLGKTFIATQLAAIVSSGSRFPFSDDRKPRCHIYCIN